MYVNTDLVMATDAGIANWESKTVSSDEMNGHLFVGDTGYRSSELPQVVLRQIQPDDEAVLPQLGNGSKGKEAGARPDIKDDLTGSNPGAPNDPVPNPLQMSGLSSLMDWWSTPLTTPEQPVRPLIEFLLASHSWPQLCASCRFRREATSLPLRDRAHNGPHPLTGIRMHSHGGVTVRAALGG
jgi:hypothetical protein